MKSSAFIGLILLSLNAFAMPEADVGTRTQDKIVPLLKDKSLSINDLKKKLSQTDVKVLDDLWDSRKDYHSDLQVVSRFEGKTDQNPLILLPGFTGYRHMNIEQIHDHIEQGYGPVYILDFRGYGEAIKNSIPLKDFVAKQDKKTKQNLDVRLSQPEIDDEHIKSILMELPIGLADEKNLDVHAEDINFIMNIAVKENPSKKFVINAHSTGAMYLMLAMSQNSEKQPWIKTVSRIVLESPFLRGMGTDKFIPIPYAFPISEVLITGLENVLDSSASVYASRSVPEFITKATGGFKPGNSLTHSPNRLSLTDSVRVWNGVETAGASWAWVKGSIDTHFDLLLPNSRFKKLNRRMKTIHKNLKENKISMVAVTPETDQIANPKGTYLFMKKLDSMGSVDLKVCKMATAGHGLNIESDKYRDPFMSIVGDQMFGKTESKYGTEGIHEVTECLKP